jgi:Tetratricopeptide repeat
MRPYYFIIAIALLLCSWHTYAAGNSSQMLWQKGTSFYQQKQYDSAAADLEQVAATSPYNAAVYYDLGNAYYRLNKIGPAVLNYERALRIDPSFQAAKDNLLLTQNRISNRIQAGTDIFFIRWWNSMTAPGKANIWSVIALCLFVIVIVLMAAKRLSNPGTYKLPVQVNGVLLFIFLCILILAFCASRNSMQNDTAVVMENDAPLMNADMKGKPILLVPEGTTITVKQESNNRAEVTLPDGRTGWLQTTDFRKVNISGI